MPILNQRNKKISNRIATVIERKERELISFRFAPSNEWYTKVVGIGKKDFAKMLKNQKQPNLTQLQAIADTLGCTVNELIEQPQETSTYPV